MLKTNFLPKLCIFHFSSPMKPPKKLNKWKEKNHKEIWGEKWKKKRKEKAQEERVVWFLSFFFFTSLFLRSIGKYLFHFPALFSVHNLYLLNVHFFALLKVYLALRVIPKLQFLLISSAEINSSSLWFFLNFFFSKIFPALIIAT